MVGLKKIFKQVTKYRGPLKGPVKKVSKATTYPAKQISKGLIKTAKKQRKAASGMAKKAAKLAVRFGKTYK